jgi:hypothetical protein
LPGRAGVPCIRHDLTTSGLDSRHRTDVATNELRPASAQPDRRITSRQQLIPPLLALHATNGIGSLHSSDKDHCADESLVEMALGCRLTETDLLADAPPRVC